SMKRLTALLLLFLTVLVLRSQVFYCYAPSSPDDLRHFLKYQQKDRDSILKNNIKHVISYNKLFNGKKGKLKRSVLASEHVYDEKGDLVSYSEYTNKGKLRYTVKYTYAANGQVSSMRMYGPSGKFKRGWKATFNSAGMVERCDNYWKKEDKLAWGYTCEYNADTLKVKEQHYDDNGNTVKIERDYYPDKQLKETRTYNKKGKLKRTIKYDCSPMGTTDDKAKTLSVCSKTSYDADSNRIETKEVTRKNKVWRDVWKYNRQNQLIEYISINDKGIQQYRYTYKYNEKGQLSELNFGGKKNRYTFTNVYEYAPGGQRTLIRYQDEKNRVWWEQHVVIQ
ncbi:MAG TPA: hypothetical protein VEC12_06170, partial [Bacteroidia bacterium]|nr:hypothetical protein [Bacteroidia bacterium]